MGDGGQDYDGALPGAPTELAPSADETAAHTAWALDNGPEWRQPFWTAGRITTVAVGAAILAIVVVAGLIGYHLQPDTVSAPVPTTTAAHEPVLTPTETSAQAPPVTVTTVVVQAPPKTVTRQAPPPASWPAAPPPPIDSAGLPPAPTVLPALVPFNDAFLAAARRNGWVVYDETLMLQQAHASCSMLQDGEPRELVSRKLMGVNPDVNWQTATQFVDTVHAIYPGCFPR